jgi:hypothetical protein
MKGVVHVAVQIQWQIQQLNQLILELSRTLMRKDAHVGVLGHAAGQLLFAGDEGLPRARSDTPELGPEFRSE